MSRQLCKTHPDVDYKIAWGCPECVRELREELAALRADVKPLIDAARCIRHWHDSDEGMVVSKAKVFLLWDALKEFSSKHPEYDAT